MHRWLVAISLLVSSLTGAQAAQRPIVGELFTSEGCSSCPPADARIRELARTRPDLLLLTFHVAYWNYLGWRDPYAFDATTERQRRYAALGVSPDVYTPSFVIDGKIDVVGSDETAVEVALREAAATQQTAASIEVKKASAGLNISIGAGSGTGQLLMVGYDRLHQTRVNRGENDGRILAEANIVRSLSVIGTWSGKPMLLQLPLPEGEETAVLLQQANGTVVGAGVAHLTGD